MTKTENKREEKKRKVIMPAGIRNKLVAAISMLMVASIMMVSSTYAWFTLSTAPEVKGITTNVGANGNLEMMLLNKASFISSAEDLGVVSDINDSMAVTKVTDANKTWGNLVDLADQSYGLQSIVINPSRLNITAGTEAGTYALNGALLKAPTYTSDGRVLDVDKETLTSGYSADKTWQWDEAADNAYGVRVIGTTSGVTERLIAYRAAISERTAQIEAAKTFARQSLLKEGQGQALADIIVKAALGKDDATFTVNDLQTLMNLIDMLRQSNEAAGKAIVQTVLAYNLGSANTENFTDADVAPLKTALESATADNLPTTFAKADGSGNGTISQPADTAAAVTKWTENKNKISTAKNELQIKIGENKESYTTDEITGIVNSLINKQFATVAGKTNPTRDDAQQIIDYLLAHNMILDIEMDQGSGVYADIAELVGDYTAAGLKVHVKYNSLEADVTTNMSTKVVAKDTTNTLPMIPKLVVGAAPAATLDPTAKPLLTDHFGYALDFGFRTNAAASDLLLQTDGIQRVYNGQNDSATAAKTQGGGSYMQFTTSNTTNFSVDELRALMSALRVVFVEPEVTVATNEGKETVTIKYNVLGVAAADITATTNDNGATYTYTGGTLLKDGAALPEGTTDGANGVKVGLNLYNYTVNDGTISLGLKKGQTEGENGVTGDVDNTLTALTQNVGKKVTAIVYLDGDIVDNTMVANAKNSMTGMLNLQFASSATLKPMDNTGMRNGGADANTVNVTYTQEKVAGESYEKEINGTTYTIKVNDGYTIYKGSDNNYYYEYNNSKNYVQFTEKGILSCPAFTIKTK